MELTTNKYKQTEVGLIPEDWNFDLIENVCDVIDPHPSHRAPAKTNIGIPFLGIGDFDERGNIISNNPRIVGFDILEEHKKRYDLNEGLIGLGRVASIGKVVSLRNDIGDYTISPTLGILKSKSINSDYLKHILNSNYIKNYFNKIMSGSTRSSVGMIVLRKVPIPMPKENEQKAIAQVLSDTDALIQALEKKIAKKKRINKGVMQQLLTPKEGWVSKPLGDIATITMGQSPQSIYYNQDEIGLPLIQGNADVEDRKTIIRYYTSVITKKGRAGETIMSVRAPVGEISRAIFDCCLGRGVCAISFPNNYLYHYLIFVEKRWSTFSTGSTFDSVNSKQISNLIINLPKSKDEQTRISHILSDMDKEIESLEQKLAKYNLAKQGVMQQLLIGKIRLV